MHRTLQMTQMILTFIWQVIFGISFLIASLMFWLVEFEPIEIFFTKLVLFIVIAGFGVLLTPLSWWWFVLLVFLPVQVVMPIIVPLYFILFIVMFATLV